MGPDDASVVDLMLNARGVEGLWIADASVMPKIVSGNTNAPSIMIGERCADFVKSALAA
jgi:choline dehydrogenase-like flavoprotein